MADLKYYDIILKPVVTEASMELMSVKRYEFYVHPEATKPQVREAVEKMFDGAKVAFVNTLNLKGKKKRTRTIKYGTRPKRKKAVVQLTAESKEIEIFQGM
jgi:large subunit ribosomal protein L23